MDASKDALICRLCGVNLTEGKHESIFEGSTDLIHKIKEILPITISIDDSGSKYVCLSCYDKIIFYYKFIQEVLEYSKRLEKTSQIKSFFNLSKEVTDFSQIHSDAVYTCPNCNVDLMILLVSNSQGCDYTFQISLAMVNHSEKKHIAKEKCINIHKDIIHFNNIHIKHGNKTTIDEETSHVSSNLLDYDYDSTDPLVKNEPESDNTYWIDSETDYKSEKDTCVTKSQDMLEKDDIQDENDIYKSCLKYVCKLCGARYLSHLKYEFHTERHKLGKIDKYECTLCDKETSNENLLWDHYFHTHKSLQRYICIECGKLFTKRSRLNGHQKNYKHSGVKQIQVGTSEDAISEDVIQKAIATTKQEKISINCNLCGKLISDLDPDAINDLVTCVTCEDSTLSLMIDGNETKVISPRQYHLNPIYQCDICNATYRVKQLLVNHIKSKHNGERRYKCAQCEKGFNDTKSLYNHVLLHTGKKPFVCEYCNMSFRRKDSRDHHRRKHTGEQPYQCPDCGESFSTYNNRSKHRKKEHGEGDPECPECGEKCNNQQEIRIHLNKHLGEKLKKLQNVDSEKI
ncbi:hypothetical protein WN51_04392 [Melipona quadrifasciata]|uniref:Uncharacterized protein n=1 Tax=Melipona quadrifasciata TaxID=166423 RepID=A0A0N0BE32_9HYME|nr:hypothetical protein WN51_04392 [Melipona quadrifasciata]